MKENIDAECNLKVTKKLVYRTKMISCTFMHEILDLIHKIKGLSMSESEVLECFK